ncbi:MAG TPA: methionine--tRNA ligase [Phycisphaerales bacterium]|nr:methionine--tRNA ligase [Phycisphaerales bacterium]
MSTYYTTTPIYYVNDKPHIGHCYTTLLADVASRFQRLVRGDRHDVFCLTGTDEHAEKVVQSARAHNVSPQQWADTNAAEYKKAFKAMNFDCDDFVRTSEDRHKSKASAYIQKLVDSGDIELGDYEGWYDPSQEEYVTDHTAKESDYTSPVTGKPLEKRTEQNYFFRLDKHEDWLKEQIESDAIPVRPSARKNEVLGRIRQGLQKVPVSRRIKEGDADWGIRMPNDPDHRIYVWIEALCNYLTAIDTPDRQRFWPADVHVMAKDILWFHAVIWPAMLRALGKEPPRMVYAHAYWVREGRKMSKSLGNFIEIETIQAYCDRYSRDAVRWYLLTQGPLGANDADFAHSHFLEVYNNELANGIGNSTSRVGNMIAKYYDGVLPRTCNGEFGFDDGVALQTAVAARVAVGKAPDDPNRTFHFPQITGQAVTRAIEAGNDFQIDEMVRQGLAIVRAVDEFITYSAPFTLAKQLDDHPEGDHALGSILYSSAEALRIASLLLAPAMPEKMAELWANWNCAPSEGVPLEELARFGGEYALKEGQAVQKGDVLFMRADPKEDPPSPITTG